MTAREIIKRIAAFRESGLAGQVTLNFAPSGQPGSKNAVASVDLHARLPLDRGEPDDGILDTVAR